MKKYTELELKDILEKHFLWLEGDPNGERADLSEANLSGVNLCRVDLHMANLYGADLSMANLSMANLSGTNIRGANLRGTYLYGADLSGANLSEANLYGAKFCGADLHESKGVNYPMTCPEKGSFIGFKRVRNNLIVELEITEDALRSSATGRKCRCSKAKVLSITNIDGTESNTNSARSLWDPDFVYSVGETIEVPDFDTNRWNECASGIHFLISRQEAVDFIM